MVLPAVPAWCLVTSRWHPNSDVFFTEVVFGHGSRVRRWSGGRVQTVAGHWMGSMDGPGVLARFDGPRGLAIDPTGALLVADGPGDYFGLYPGESQTIRRGTAGVVAPPASCPVTVPSPTIDVPQFGSGFLTIGGTRVH